MKLSSLMRVAFTFAITLNYSFFYAQTEVNDKVVEPLTTNSCGFDQLHQEMMQNDKGYALRTEQFNDWVRNVNFEEMKVSSTPYRVPVVVHVMETGNSLTDITDQQIKDGIQQLNNRYRKVPGTLGDGNGVDVGLEFALAVRDESGNCTDGIVRYDMTGNATYMTDGVYRQSSGITDASLKALSVWDQTQYYNIWLVSEIDGNDGGAGIQGYAYFASSHGTSVDGAVILVSNWKSPTSTTGTHEIGHAFNLYHTFEGDGTGATCPSNSNCNTQGDQVCDTPPHRRSSSDCVIGTNSCDGGSSTELFIHNYMDYSADYCQSEFTAGQSTRVIAAMTGVRSSFLASNGNMSLVPPAIANVDFTASGSFVCSGSDIQFFDLSSCTPNTYLDTTDWTGITFSWSFDNGSNVYTSTLQNPIMTLPVGSYDVTLSVTNSFGTDTQTYYDFVVVGNSPVGACSPGSNNEANYAQTVYEVNFNTLSNSTSSLNNIAYTDYSCTYNTLVTDGQTYSMDVSIRAGGSASEVVEVYIDYNNNGTFEAGELVLSGSTATNTTNTVSGNVTIPGTAVQGQLLRMRVYGEAGSLTNNERNCVTNLFIGDVEDYGVYVQSACVTPVISVTSTSNPSVCGNSDGSITINGTGSGDVTWSGTASGSAPGVSLPYTITGLAAGSYSIQYGSGACVSSVVNQSLNDPSAPTTPVITPSGATTFCEGGSVMLTSSYASGNTWSTAETTQSITVTTSGDYSVTYTDGGGCSSTSTVVTVTVNPLPAAPTVTPSGTVEICSGGSTILTSSSSSNNVWSTAETTQSITVSAAGDYSVYYTDINGCASPSSAVTTVVVGGAGTALPISEGFNTFIPTGWTITNPNSNVTWVQANYGTAPSGTPCASMNNYSTDITGQTDDLNMLPVDLSGLTSATLTFDVAYARYDATYNDQLDVLISDDCGQSYSTIYSKAGSTLATDPDQTAGYTPSTWRNESIDLTPYVGSDKVDIIFRNISGYGQLLYIDNVNLTGVAPCIDPDVPTTSGDVAICNGNSTTLSITSGNLNSATDWQWYTTSCGGSSVGNGTTLNVTPSVTTTYYVRGEGGCVTPGSCTQVTVTVNDIATGTDVVSACDSYLWIDGNTYTSSNNTATHTLVGGAANGCDSIVTLNLTINNSNTGTDVISTCDSYTWIDGNTYTASNNTATHTLLNAAGCDSVVTLDLTINSSTTGTDVITACDTYTWIDGNTYTASNNTATHTLLNAAGCDSVVTLNLTINNSTTGTDVISACDSYTWIDGNTYTASNNTATHTLLNAAGCDSVVTLDLTINSSTIGTDVISACDTYTWIDGNTYTASNNTATHTIVGGAANGCDSVVTLNLTINTATTGTDVISACDSYLWIDGNTYTSSNNTATHTLVGGATNGCDSIVTLNLTINNSNTGTDVITACDSYTWIDGNTYTSSNNTATHTLLNAAGCDSVVTLNLTINNSTSGTDVITACDSYTWIDGNTYTTSNNTATHTLLNAVGCDSVVTLDLTINNSTTGTDVITACDSYSWIDGNTYTSSNNTATYTIVGGAANGCDSVVTLNLTINNSTTATDVITACDSYLWIDGNTYTSSNNTATHTLLNAAGCDSVVTLNLTINNSNSGTDVITSCAPITWIDGNTYSASNNTATHTILNAAGCDSVVTLDFTLSTFASGTDVITACDSYIWIDGNTYTTSNNTATHTIVGGSVNGCDSVVTLNLTINNSTTGTDVISACDSYTWIDGNTYTSSNNTATHTLPNAVGCDSVVTLNLTINNSTTGTDVITACDSYMWIDGNTYTSSNNSATHTLLNAAGCDSVVTLNLTINNSTTGTDVISACDSYTWIDGNTYTASNNTATHTLFNAAGCDSVVTLDLTINNSTTGTDVVTACDSYTWIDGNTYTSSNNTATHTLLSAAGCDSVVTLNLTINNSTTGTDVVTACDSYTWIDGNTYTASNNTATHILPNAVGCDSVVTLNLTINNSTTGTDVITACDSYTWIDGNTYTASNNSATHTLMNAVGCDSVVTLDLTINNSTTGTDVITSCAPITWIDGNTYSASNNTATYTIPNAAGCDSLVTLDFTLSTFVTGTDVITACDSYMWIDGNTYTSSNNTATHTLVGGAANGCDSVVTLNLTINNSTTGTDIIAACDTYTWIDGNTYTASNNTATHTLPNAAGCDSTVTLNLTINTSPTVTLDPVATLCQQDGPVTLVGSPVGGTYSGTSVTGDQFDPSIGVGNYTVTYDYTDGATGCSSSDAQIIVVENCASIDEEGLANLEIHPNPTNAIINITLEGEFTYELIDNRGRLIQKGDGTDTVQLDLSQLESSVYIIKISNDSGTRISRVMKD